MRVRRSSLRSFSRKLASSELQVLDHGGEAIVAQFGEGGDASFLAQLGHRLGRQVRIDQVDRAPEIIQRQMLQQVGRVGRVQLVDRALQEVAVAGFDRILELVDHRWRDDARNIGLLLFGLAAGRIVFGNVIHPDLPFPASGVLSC